MRQLTSEKLDEEVGRLMEGYLVHIEGEVVIESARD
jgi:hypothetical protein